MRECTYCGFAKPLDNFTVDRNRPDGVRLVCRACAALQRADWYARNTMRSRQYTRDWQRANPERAHTNSRASALRTRYGISSADYDLLLHDQNYVCAICGADKPGGTSKYFHVDHDHATGVVRGLLCSTCNLALGHLHDNPNLCRRAATYLEAPLG